MTSKLPTPLATILSNPETAKVFWDTAADIAALKQMQNELLENINELRKYAQGAINVDPKLLNEAARDLVDQKAAQRLVKSQEHTLVHQTIVAQTADDTVTLVSPAVKTQAQIAEEAFKAVQATFSASVLHLAPEQQAA